MAKKLFPEHELYLLDNWGDACELEDSMDSTRETYKGILDDVLKKVRGEHKEFDCQGFHLGYPADYALNIGVGKKAWHSLWPKWPSGFWLSNLWLENLISEDECHPSACVYIAPEKSTLDLADASNAILHEAEKRKLLLAGQIASIEVVSNKKSQAWIAWPLPESRRELLDLLRHDEAKGFINRMVEHFELLSQFIPVMDRIFQDGKQSRK